MQLLLAGVALLACAGAAVVTVLRVRAERRARDQVRAVAARLAPAEPPRPGDDLARALARLARAADSAVARSAEAEGLASALAGVLQNLPVGVVVTAPDGRVVFRNPATDALLHPPAGDAALPRPVSELLAAAASGQPASRSLELYGPPRRTLSLTAVPLAGGAAVVVEDASDRRRLDAVRRDFVANVSHELKTPVAAIGLLAETLCAEDDPAVVRRLAERMQDEAFRAARVIEDLLDLSRLEAEEGPRHEPLAVHAVVQQAVERVRPAAALRSVRLVVGEVPRTWTVRGERRQLVSAVANLLDNAVKYSGEGSGVEVDVRRHGDAVDVVVTDHGIGIPSRDLDRIFERFYRVDRGRGRDTGGTGLGLSIVRHVASNHGGEVVVESEEGRGSTFTLRLPAEPVALGLVVDAG